MKNTIILIVLAAIFPVICSVGFHVEGCGWYYGLIAGIVIDALLFALSWVLAQIITMNDKY